MIAERLNRLHPVGGENDRAAALFQPQNLIRNQLGIHRVETGEWLIENNQFRLVKDGTDKLHFLCHTLREVLYFLIPPVLNLKSLEPNLNALKCILLAQTF